MSETVINLPAAPQPKREIQNVIDAIPIMDTARFEHFQRIAAVMARSTMIPESLRTSGKGDDKQPLPFEQVLSNCFLIVNQAARWQMDPFSVISCCAVVHGRLAYEGKLVSAVLAAKLNISLNHYFTGEAGSESYRIYLCDRPFTDELIAQLKPGAKIPGLRLWDGSVAEWKTTGAGTPWTPKNYPRMLIYRGTRDWTRIYESAILLGVYTEDELADLTEDARARRATPVSSVSLADRLIAARLPGTSTTEGFSHEHVTRETGGQTQESKTAAGDASHSATPHDATLHERTTETIASATDAHGHPDRIETVGGSLPGGSHEVGPSESEPTRTSDSTDSNSLQSSVPIAAATKPVAEDAPSPDATGNLQSSELSPADDEEQAGNVGSTGLPSTLPQGWALAYCGALRRAQSKGSLPKYAKQFWAQYGSWDDHKDGPDAATATAVYDAFNAHFGQPEALADALREII